MKKLLLSPQTTIFAAIAIVITVFLLEIFLPAGVGWFVVRVVLALSGALAGSLAVRVWLLHQER